MTTDIAEKQHAGLAADSTLEPCSDMREAEEIWSAFESQQPAWDFNATWICFRTWVTHFSPGATHVLKMTAAGRPVGLFPAHMSRRSAAGIGFRVVSPPGNEHWGTGYPIVGNEPDTAIRALVSGLKGRRDWDVMEIGPMLSDCPLVPLLNSIGEAAMLAPMICHREDDWRVQISGTWEGYFKGRSANLRQIVARGGRRLAALGEVTFEVFTGGADFPERFAEFCQVEGSGWKGRAGTAIRCDPSVMKFHEDLMQSAAAAGQLRLFFLRLNGRVVACNEIIIHDGVANLIKLGRDETLDACWPGHIAFKRILEHFFRTREAHTFDTMIGGGAHSAYKARWATETREYLTLRFFNPKTVRGTLARGWFSRRRQAGVRVGELIRNGPALGVGINEGGL